MCSIEREVHTLVLAGYVADNDDDGANNEDVGVGYDINSLQLTLACRLCLTCFVRK